MGESDNQAIRDVVARYADAVCRRDPEQWIGTWSTAGQWDLGGGRVVKGRDDILALWLSAIKKYPWVAQVLTSGIVSGDEQTARGAWYILELNHLEDGSGVMHLGHYEDTYVREDGEWRFASRHFHLIYRGAMDPGTVVPLPPRD